MDIKDLKKIGLTDGEIKIYDALLKLGETTRTELAKKSGISPSKIYDVTNRLIEKGIISAVKKNGILHFSPANPEKIISFIEKKEEDIKKEKEIVTAIMPSLQSWYKDVKEKTDVEVFYGWEGMKTVYDDIAKSLCLGDTDYVFGASMGENSRQADLFFSKYYAKAKKKGYKIKIIFNKEVKKNTNRTNYLVRDKLHEIRYLDQKTLTEINIYKNRVLIIMLLTKPMAIRINGKDSADSFRKFFETMWAIAKK